MPSSISSSRPLGLVLGLALFAGSEWALWSNGAWARFLLQHEPAAASGDTLGVAARIRLIDPREAPLLVLLGSSQVREGLDCAILAPSPGTVRCVNLGIGGGSPLDMLYISRELGNRPRTAVISIFPGVLSKAPKSGFVDTQTLRAVVASVDLSGTTPDEWRLLGSGLLQTLSPTLRHREGLRSAFDEAPKVWPNPQASPRTSRERRTSDQDRQPPAYFANRINRTDSDMDLSKFTATQELALELLIRRETRAGHGVVVADFPTRPGFETTLGEDVRVRYSSLLARLRSRSDIRFVEATALGPLAEGDFIDFTHLDSNGRRRVSERLGALVRPQ